MWVAIKGLQQGENQSHMTQKSRPNIKNQPKQIEICTPSLRSTMYLPTPIANNEKIDFENERTSNS